MKLTLDEPLDLRRVVLQASADLGLVVAVVATFLLVYVFRFGQSAVAVMPHIALVATLWGACLTLRLVICRAVQSDRLARWINASIVGTSLLVLGICEMAFVVGLSSWGRVPTWPLVRTYAAHPVELLSALELSPVVFASMLAAFASLLLVAFSRPASPSQWVIAFASRVPGRWLLILFVTGSLVVSVRLYSFVVSPPVETREPFSLMLFPEQGARPGQTRSTYAHSLDVAESSARAAYVPAAPSRPRNVVLIVGDALRADHMSVNGYSRRTTPYIDSLVSSGRARSAGSMVSVCAESSCGLMAIAQSRYAHRFPEKPITLYEVLRLHGYSVRLIFSGDHTNFYGLRDSFGTVDEYVDGSMAAGYYANDDRLVIDRLSALPPWDGRPVMMQLHLMSSHVLGRRMDAFERFRPFVNYARFGKNSSKNPESIRQANNFYDNGVLQFDAMVRATIEALSVKGYLQDAIVVITADHGEMLGEHGAFSHSAHVYQEALKIPFIVVDFGGNGIGHWHMSGLLSQVDIAPTILHELDVPIPSTWDGHALQRERQRRYVYFQQGAQVGLFDVGAIDQVWKYWLNLSSGEQFAFNLSHANSEGRNEIADASDAARSRWRLAVIGAGASVALF